LPCGRKLEEVIECDVVVAKDVASAFGLLFNRVCKEELVGTVVDATAQALPASAG